MDVESAGGRGIDCSLSWSAFACLSLLFLVGVAGGCGRGCVYEGAWILFWSYISTMLCAMWFGM